LVLDRARGNDRALVMDFDISPPGFCQLKGGIMGPDGCPIPTLSVWQAHGKPQEMGAG
jgi:hypothetical protein